MKFQEKHYDVAFSYAKEDRSEAREIADILKDHYELSVFLDADDDEIYNSYNLHQDLSNLYANRCFHCILIESPDYKKKTYIKNVELPNIQKRITQSGASFLTVVIKEKDEICETLHCGVHFDLKEKNIEEVAHIIGRKILREQYEQKIQFNKLNQKSSGLSATTGFIENDFEHLFSELLFNTRSGEILYVGIAAERMITRPRFLRTFEMLTEKCKTENKTITVRMFLLDLDSAFLKLFAEKSDESVDIVRNKIERIYELSSQLIEDNRKILNLRLYFYKSMPCMNAFIIDEEVYMRPLKIKNKQDPFTVFSDRIDPVVGGLGTFVFNFIEDLKERSRYEDINWVSE